MPDTLFGQQMPMPNMPQMMSQGMPNVSLQGEFNPGGFSSGAMGGAVFNNLEDTMNRNFRDSDLQYQNALLQFDQNQKNVPLADAQRQLAMTGTQQAQETLGKYGQQSSDVAALAGIAGNQAKISGSQMEDTLNHANGMHFMNEVVKATPDFEKNPAAQKEVRDIAAKTGITNLHDDPVELKKQIASWAAAAENNIPFQQKLKEMDTAYKQQVGAKGYAAGVGIKEMELESARILRQAGFDHDDAMRYAMSPTETQAAIDMNRDIANTGVVSGNTLSKMRAGMAQNPVVQKMNESITEKSILTQYAGLSNTAERQKAAIMDGIPPEVAKTITDSNWQGIISHYVPEISRQHSMQNAEDQVGRVIGQRTVDEGNGPEHYVQDKQGHYQLVPGAGTTQPGPQQGPAIPKFTAGPPQGAVTKRTYSDGRVEYLDANKKVIPTAAPAAAAQTPAAPAPTDGTVNTNVPDNSGAPLRGAQPEAASGLSGSIVALQQQLKTEKDPQKAMMLAQAISKLMNSNMGR